MEENVVLTPARKFIKKHQLPVIVLAILLIIAAIFALYYYRQYNQLNNILKNPNIAVQNQTNDLVMKVGKLMILPTDETPTVATVTDASKLKDQLFFKMAANGDKVLIYVKNRKAILYDPNKNVIVDVAPVNIAQNQVTPTPTPTPTPYVPKPTISQ